jgi:hypothetical protein
MNTNGEKPRWKDALDGMFEKPMNDELAWMCFGMIVFEGIRNSYPEVDATEVAIEVARHISFHEKICALINQGRLECARHADGKYVYRRTSL